MAQNEAIMTAKVRKNAEVARSNKGTLLPKSIINAICELQNKRPDLNFIVGSGKDLERNLNFFRKFSYRSTIVLYDRLGQKFSFSGKARPVRRKEIFIGVCYSEKYHRATVYAYFPLE